MQDLQLHRGPQGFPRVDEREEDRGDPVGPGGGRVAVQGLRQREGRLQLRGRKRHHVRGRGHHPRSDPGDEGQAWGHRSQEDRRPHRDAGGEELLPHDRSRFLLRGCDDAHFHGRNHAQPRCCSVVRCREHPKGRSLGKRQQRDGAQDRAQGQGPHRIGRRHPAGGRVQLRDPRLARRRFHDPDQQVLGVQGRQDPARIRPAAFVQQVRAPARRQRSREQGRVRSGDRHQRPFPLHVAPQYLLRPLRGDRVRSEVLPTRRCGEQPRRRALHQGRGGKLRETRHLGGNGRLQVLRDAELLHLRGAQRRGSAQPPGQPSLRG